MIREMNHIDQLRGQLRRRVSPPFGVGRMVGYLILLSFFTLIPMLLKQLWPWMLQNLSETQMYVGSIFVMNIGIFTIYNGIMYIIYTIKHPFFQQYKNTDKKWPWQQNTQNWKKLKVKSIKYLMINFFIVTPTMVFVSLQTSLPYSFSLQEWPTGIQLFIQFMLFLIVQDIAFYYAHRLLHLPKFYWIHKLHHEYHQTIGIAAHVVHPIQYVLAGTIPSTLGFQTLVFFYPVHYVTVLIFLLYRIIQSYEGHCGYTWSWNTLSLFPMTVGSDHHDFHHAGNCGNYGSVFLFLDAFHKTQTYYQQNLEKRVKMNKNKVK